MKWAYEVPGMCVLINGIKVNTQYFLNMIHNFVHVGDECILGKYKSSWFFEQPQTGQQQTECGSKEVFNMG